MKNKSYLAVSVLSFAFLIFGSFTYAEEQATSEKSVKDQVQSKIEMQEKMSDVHKKAAECLKLGKPEKECYQPIMAMHKDMKG